MKVPGLWVALSSLLAAACSAPALDEPRLATGAEESSAPAALTVADGVAFTAPGTAVMLPEFGSGSIALSADTLLVTAFKEAIAGGGHVGPVIAFLRSAGGWVEQGRLAPPEPGSRTGFGFALAMSGDRVIVGAPERNEFRGAAYVFARTGGVWSLEATLLPDAIAPVVGGREHFGCAVALAGDLAVVGAEYFGSNIIEAAGGAYVFAREGGQWLKKTVLRPSRAQLLYPRFGRQVALEGRLVAVAASSQDSDGKNGAGGVYLYEDASGTGAFPETAYIAPSDVVAADNFGAALALSRGVLAVGAAYGDNSYFPPRIGPANVGKVYVFERRAAGAAAWTQTARLTTTSSSGLTKFGGSVALQDDLLLVGASYEDGLAGAVHLYRASAGGWELVKRLSAGVPGTDDLGNGAYFGLKAVLNRRTVVVGGNPARIPLRTYDLRRDEGDACVDGTECGNGFCVDGVCCQSACGNGVLDCQACSLTAGGTQNGLCTPLAPARAAAVICRASGGGCDVAEVCTPSALTCPADIDPTACMADAGTAAQPDAAKDTFIDGANEPVTDGEVTLDAGEDAFILDAVDGVAAADAGGGSSSEASSDGGLRDAVAVALVDAPANHADSDGCSCNLGRSTGRSPLPPSYLLVAALVAAGSRRRRRH